MKTLIAAIVAVCALLLAIPALAQETTVDTSAITDDEVNAIAKKMFCLECENIPLDVCGTQACIQWRDEIRLQLAEGRTEAEILEYFRVNHGEQALAEPGDPVLRVLTNATPYVFALLALAGGVFVVFRWQRNASSELADTRSDDGPPDDYLAQLEQDLRNS
ncbi:MAG: cytochrome c-type biogenesis protein CcmH [Chloroflexota bacterium]